MAEEAQPAAQPSPPSTEVVVAADPAPEKPTDKDPPPAPTPEPEDPKPTSETAPVSEEADTKPAAIEEEAIPQSVSFKEESNRVSDLPDPERKALEELKQLIQEALKKHEFTYVPPPPKEEKSDPPAPEEAKPATEEPVAVEPEPATTAEEPPKPESETVPAAAEEEKPPAAVAEPEAVITEVVEETIVAAAVAATPAVDDDGAKTVEAIEETVVAVTAHAPPPECDAPTKEAEPAAAEPAPAEVAAPELPPEEVSIWGIQLLSDDERSDVVLLKFLRARDFKVKEAFAMIKNTVRWRKEFGIDGLLEEDLGNDLEKVVFMHGFDKEGHAVCYNVYGEFQNKELYQKTLSDEEKRQKFLRWRIQFLEKGVRQLDFSPTGICTLVQVTDLKNSPGPGKRGLRQATNQAVSLLQDNYPEFAAKQIMINVPWWYLAFNRMISPFLTQRTKSKFVFAGPSKSTETLFKYIAPEQVPVQFGGLSKDNDTDFSTTDAVTEITIKPASKHTVEIPVSETCLLVWELRVLGWDVSYGAEFVPSAEDGYTVIVQKTRKVTATDEPFVKNSFKIGESGKVVLTIDNTTSKKKKLLYRSKTKSSSECI
ncbi:patellin-3-like [Magnolia sinica]|uniref:patellin-3-like n=1 Tax=Magnolia sinica TaxID=86752 RepID=UPI002659325F|nr:patellin-3-like [Magnolia sinica]